MSHIITDVIIGVILLSMLLFVIPIYRHQHIVEFVVFRCIASALCELSRCCGCDL